MDENSIFFGTSEGPPDPVLGVAAAFAVDSHPQKVNLGVGAYRDEEGKPYVFPVVAEVQNKLCKAGHDKEYLPIDGLPALKVATQKLIFGADAPAICEGRIVSAQVLSGTGGLRVAAEFIRTQIPRAKELYVSKPTWANHLPLFRAAGFSIKEYAYWDPATKNLDFANLLADLQHAPQYSVIVLHACAHNPTGVDPTLLQWEQILDVMKERRLIPLFDCAYQGYASGDLDQDAASIRMFLAAGFEFFVSQSFAKNMGLYGERVGMLHVVCHNKETAKVVLSQVKPVIRRMYSNPPIWGGRIACEILSNPAHTQAWIDQLKGVAERIKHVRKLLQAGLEEKETPGDWSHITRQIGMFSYTGLCPEACERLTDKWHVYLLKSGRISLAGINSNNIDYLIDAIDECVKTVRRSNL